MGFDAALTPLLVSSQATKRVLHSEQPSTLVFQNTEKRPQVLESGSVVKTLPKET
ncbi:hypothetical protein M23134_00064 [Microscilla marina ATCC 23134]|uniref:Uncharacterized protein n=1 Tax=Microscilla marina ATCC 23134 TaxID=313606 RepID=A1ZKU4_MICM2|nr:hypothetical protein M23134_00064 [Microscilla marina ATCC 23134]